VQALFDQTRRKCDFSNGAEIRALVGTVAKTFALNQSYVVSMKKQEPV